MALRRFICGLRRGRVAALLSISFGVAAFVKRDAKYGKEREVVHSITIAEMALKDGNLQKAQKMLDTALEKAEHADVRVGVTCALDLMATLAYRQGDSYLAEKHLLRAIGVLKSFGVRHDDNEIVSFLLKLARMYHKIHRDADAERVYGRCVDLQLPKTASTTLVDATTGALCVSALFWFGDFLAQSGRNSEAAVRLEQAYDIAARVPCVTPAQVMVILYNLAEVSCALPDYDAALRYLLSAAVLGRDTNHPDLSSYYMKIGMIYRQKGLYEQAHAWYEQGRKRASSTRNKDLEKEATQCIAELRTAA